MKTLLSVVSLALLSAVALPQGGERIHAGDVRMWSPGPIPAPCTLDGCQREHLDVPGGGGGGFGHGDIPPERRLPVFHQTNAPQGWPAVSITVDMPSGTKEFVSSPPGANWYVQCQTSMPTPWGTTQTVSTPKLGSASNHVWKHAVTMKRLTKGVGPMQAGAPNFAPAKFSSAWAGVGKYQGMTHRVAVWVEPGQDEDDAYAAFTSLLEAMTKKFPAPHPGQ